MFNKKQRASLARMAYKLTELLIAGVVITGVMQADPPLGKMLLAVSISPFPFFFGLLLESGIDGEDKPP